MGKKGKVKLDEDGKPILKLDILTRNSYKVIRNKLKATCLSYLSLSE